MARCDQRHLLRVAQPRAPNERKPSREKRESATASAAARLPPCACAALPHLLLLGGWAAGHVDYQAAAPARSFREFDAASGTGLVPAASRLVSAGGLLAGAEQKRRTQHSS